MQESMTFGRMVLGKVVGEIVGAFFPVDAELALADAVLYPVKMHVDRFGAVFVLLCH